MLKLDQESILSTFYFYVGLTRWCEKLCRIVC